MKRATIPTKSQRTSLSRETLFLALHDGLGISGTVLSTLDVSDDDLASTVSRLGAEPGTPVWQNTERLVSVGESSDGEGHVLRQ